jgi:RNA recognition motif-containing protein
MNTKIYFDNLPETVTEKELTDLFSAYGNVVNVRIVADRTNHPQRSSGFVTMITPEGARTAIQSLNGKILGSGILTLSEVSPKEELAISKNDPPGPRRLSSCLY